MSNTPAQRYQQDLERHGYISDAAQLQAVQALQQLYERLVEEYPQSPWGNGGNLLRRVSALASGLVGRRQQRTQRGLYFWGGVGRGKTYLMDIFFESLPFEQKMRTHFHRFMRRVHSELKTLKSHKDPLNTVADRLADEAWVICFDEFFVIDITDAMILANLLERLFERGVVLVATSNIAPDGLYKDGLQRVRFLPAIELLKKHTAVLNVDGGVDYRLRALQKAALYYDANDSASEQQLQDCFNSLVPDTQHVEQNVSLEINGRNISAKCISDDVAWFSFAALCDGPRSQNDYIEIAREFHAVIVAGVPLFTERNDDQARRFIYLVDEFYDRNVKLILSADKPMLQLYSEGRLAFEFERTVSRLQEMQSQEYLAREHKA